MKHVDLAGLGVDTTSGTPVVILREHDDPHRLLPLFIGGAEAAAIAHAVEGLEPPRPGTHDVMAALVRGLDGHLDAVEITSLVDGVFRADLAVHGPAGAQRLDTRPSDAIALAIRLGAPLLVADEVLDEAGTLPADEVDEAEIESTVEEFRGFLDEVTPEQFAELSPGGTTDGPGPDDDSDDTSGTPGAP